MSQEFTKIVKGIILEGLDVAPVAPDEGSLHYRSDEHKIKVKTDNAVVEEVITNLSTQTLENKTLNNSTLGTVSIDADTNPISNLETDNFKAGVIDSDNTLAADSDTVIPTQKAVKKFVEDSILTKDEASEISYDNSTSGLTAVQVQTAIDEVEGRVDTAENDISVHEIDTSAHGTTGNVVGTSDTQILTNKSIDAVSNTITNIGDSNLTSGINAEKIADGSVSNTELQHINSITSNVQDQLDSKLVSSDLTTHESDTSTHGVGEVVGTDEVQILTNKTLTSPDINTPNIDGGTVDTSIITDSSIVTPSRLDVKQDTLANLETYATTASNGQFVFATDSKESYQIIDNELAAVGGGSGVGDASIYNFIDADSVKLDAWTTSLTNATFTLDETTPLAGEKSYLFTTTATSDGEYIYYNCPIPLRSQDRDVHKLELPYHFNGTKGYTTIELYDVTNSEIIKTIEIDPNEIGGKLIFSLPVDCVEIRIYIRSVTGEASVFEFDQISLSDKAFDTGSMTTTNSIQLEGNDGRDITADTEDIHFSGTGTGWTSTGNDNYYTVQYKDSNINLVVGTVYTSSGIDGMELYKNGVKYRYLKHNGGSYYTQNASYLSAVGEFEVGDRISVRVNSDRTLNNTSLQERHYLNIIETAQSDTVIFEDTRSQAHFVGKAIYNLSSTYNTTSTSFILPILSLSSSSLSGDLEQNTANAPSLTIPDAKIGTYKIEVTGMMGGTSNSFAHITMTDGISNYSAQTTYASYESSKVFIVENLSERTLNLDLNVKEESSTFYIDARPPLELSVTYLPPVEQANVPTLFALPASKENDFYVTATSAGVLSNFDGAANWCSFVSKGGTGVYNYTLNEDIFTSGIFPNLGGDSFDSSIRGFFTLGTFPAFSFTIYDGSYADKAHYLSASKSGADRTPAGVWAGDVAKELVGYIEIGTNSPTDPGSWVTSSTTWKVRNLNYVIRDLVGSVLNDTFISKKGLYNFSFDVQSHTAQSIYCDIRKNGNAPENSVADWNIDYGFGYANVDATSGGRVDFTINLEHGDTLEFLTKSQDATGNELIGRIKVRKLS